MKIAKSEIMKSVKGYILPAAVSLVVILLSEPAGSQENKGEKPKAPDYMIKLVKGHDAYILKDHEKALSIYKEAGQLKPKKSLVHYFIGCGLTALKRYEEAIDSFKTAFLMATDNIMLKAMASFNIARVYELAGEFEKALTAWKDFSRMASENDSLKKFRRVAEKRIEALEKIIELNKKYEIVRQRIKKKQEEG